MRAADQRQFDKACEGYCIVLLVDHGKVKQQIQSTDAPVEMTMGRYLTSAAHLIPSNEAAISDRRASNGWRIVISAFLDHQESSARLRIRFFDSRGLLQLKNDSLTSLEDQEFIRPNKTDCLYAVTTNEEHVYNAQTEIWFLPNDGVPKLVLSDVGTFQIPRPKGSKAPTIVFLRETYDGIHSETKGHTAEQYTWDANSKMLVRSQDK
jgi:hypothetical protein